MSDETGPWRLLCGVLFCACVALAVALFLDGGDDGADVSPDTDLEALREENARLERRVRDAERIAEKQSERVKRYAESLESLAAEAEKEGLRAVHWTPVFVDTFDRDELGPHWEPFSGVWTVQDGKMVCDNLRTDSIIICTGADFSADVQVSYRARTVKCYNGQACDLSFMTSVPARKPVQALAGYLWRFGSYDNVRTGLTRPGADLADVRTFRIVPGRWHHVVIQRFGGVFSMTIDDKIVFSVKDAAAIPPAGRSWGGIYTFKSHIEVDDVIVSLPTMLAPEIDRDAVVVPLPDDDEREMPDVF